MRLMISLSFLSILLFAGTPAGATGDPSKYYYYHFPVYDGTFTSTRLASLGGSDLTDSHPASFLVNPATHALGNRAGISYGHADFPGEEALNTYAGTAEWEDWRLNFAVEEFNALMVTPNIYDPQSQEDPIDLRLRMTALGISYNLGQSLTHDPSFRWTVGTALKMISDSSTEGAPKDKSLDLGTTFSWTTQSKENWTAVSIAASWQNLTKEARTSFNWRSAMSHQLGLGVIVETAHKKAGQETDIYKVLLAYTRILKFSSDYSHHVGLEALFFSTLALRFGHDSRHSTGMTSWGAGLMLDPEFLGPVSLELDYGKMGFGNSRVLERETTWGVLARYNY